MSESLPPPDKPSALAMAKSIVTFEKYNPGQAPASACTPANLMKLADELVLMNLRLIDAQAAALSAQGKSSPPHARLSDCPLENCEKTGRCEFPQDCDAPSSAPSHALHNLCRYPECMPAGTQCPHDRKDHCALNQAPPSTTRQIASHLTDAEVGHLYRDWKERFHPSGAVHLPDAYLAGFRKAEQREFAASATPCSRNDVLEAAALVCEARAKDDEYTGGEKAGLHYAAFNIRALKNSPDGGVKT